MKKGMRRDFIRSLFLVGVGVFCLSLSEKSDHPLRVALQIERTTVPLRASFLLHLMITNEEKDEPLELTFSSAQRYDFIITKEGQEIWRWSKGKVFAMMVDETVVQRGEPLHYTETWDQRDNHGEIVPPGRYEIVGVLKTQPEIVSEPVMIEIKGITESVLTS